MREGIVLDERYEIGAELGRGSTATVHRALDRTSGEDVAVKMFTSGPSPADAGRDRREIRILAALRHPGLVSFLDAGTADGERYVVTDLVDGRSLADALLDGPMDAAAVADLGAELADALAYVHGQGVVHRDVKPANILLDRDGRPRLADFGIARLDGATKVTHTGVIIGTAAYMAPEQVRGHDVTAPADVYSLGLVLLEALTGEREFPGSAVEAAVARLHRPPRIPATAGPGLTGVLRRMTAIAPGTRPDAAEVARLLRSLPEPGAARRGGVRRLLPLAAVAVLASGLATGYVLSGTGADATASTATVPAEPPAETVAGTVAPVIKIVEADATARSEGTPTRAAGSGDARAPRPAGIAPVGAVPDPGPADGPVPDPAAGTGGADPVVAEPAVQPGAPAGPAAGADAVGGPDAGEDGDADDDTTGGAADDEDPAGGATGSGAGDSGKDKGDDKGDDDKGEGNSGKSKDEGSGEGGANGAKG